MASTVPAALAALAAAIQAAPALSGVVVYDGSPDKDATAREWVGVGWTPDGSSSVDFDREWAAIGGMRVEERYTVHCSLATNSGDAGMSARRSRAFDLLDAISAAVAGDPTLGGAVRLAAVLGAGSLEQDASGGAAAGIKFDVAVQARINQ